MKRVVSLAVVVAVVAAHPAAAEDVQVTYRLAGLFQPDRVDDLKRQASELPVSNNAPVEVKLVSVDYDTAVVTFGYDSESQSFKARQPDQVFQHIDNLVRNASRGSFHLFRLSEVKADQLREERIAVAGLDCKGCAFGAYRAIATIDGVDRAVVSFKEGHVTARIDPAKTNRKALVEALQKAQVDVTAP